MMPIAFHAKFIETESAEHTATFSEQSNDVRAAFDAKVHMSDVFPSDDLPLMDGEPSPGISKLFSRSDHRHPHDSEKMDYMSAITNLELEAMLK